TGAKLKSMTQSLAYKTIRAKKMKTYTGRRRTKLNIEQIQSSIEERFRVSLKESEIRKSLRHGDLTRECKYFLWMTAHDAYMVGSNWQRPNYKPELQERARCDKCNVLEDMKHILTECASNGQRTVWKLAGKLWEKKGMTWKDPDLGSIL
ncbi:hypothetical protein L218DRAFT_821602, partial [Marasmius fiardii PR-910]